MEVEFYRARTTPLVRFAAFALKAHSTIKIQGLQAPTCHFEGLTRQSTVSLIHLVNKHQYQSHWDPCMWLFQQSGFLAQERAQSAALRRAFDQARNRDTISRGDRQLLNGQNAQFLYAVNSLSRIQWAQSICQEFQDHFHLGPQRRYPDQDLYFVTLADIRCWTTELPEEIDLPRFQAILRKGLNGLSYLGMIEPGLYVNVSVGSKRRKGVSWHFHAICWGCSPVQLRDRFRQLNQALGRYQPVAPGPLCLKLRSARRCRSNNGERRV